MRVSGAGGFGQRSLEVGRNFHMGYPTGNSGRGKPSRPGKFWEKVENTGNRAFWKKIPGMVKSGQIPPRALVKGRPIIPHF